MHCYKHPDDDRAWPPDRSTLAEEQSYATSYARANRHIPSYLLGKRLARTLCVTPPIDCSKHEDHVCPDIASQGGNNFAAITDSQTKSCQPSGVLQTYGMTAA